MGFLVIVVGIVPIFPTTIRLVVGLVGTVIVLVAISRALAGKTGDRELDRLGPKTQQDDTEGYVMRRR